jgi:ATP-dependent Lon protease
MPKDNDHPYNTRSKDTAPDKKKRVCIDDDVDSHGNVKGLIDYEYDEEGYQFPLHKLYSTNNTSDLSENNEGEYVLEIDAGGEGGGLKGGGLKGLLQKYLTSKVIEKVEEKLKDGSNAQDEIEYTDHELDYLEKLSKKEKTKINKLEKEIIDYSKHDVPHRFRILNGDMSIRTKDMALKKLDSLYCMTESDSEFHKLSSWVDHFMKIPFGEYIPTKVSRSDKTEDIAKYLYKMKENMDKSVYGHDEAKGTIVQYMAEQIMNPNASGKVLAIQGPMGNGKTTLVKEGIAKSLDKPFALIALGGASDAATLEGHDYTYEGSKVGRIVEIIQEAGVMNPVIFFDELDKVSETSKGQEIINLLCHLTDSTQNMQFHDKYFSGVDIDLSKATFIFSFNDEDAVNPILKDRMNVIRTNGFEEDAKIKIANEYLLPSICRDIGFDTTQAVFPDKIVKHIISKNEEKGVRNLRRSLHDIISKLNLLSITHSYKKESVIEEDKPANDKPVDTRKKKKEKDVLQPFSLKDLSFPITITKEMCDTLLKQDHKISEKQFLMYT